MKKKLLAYLLSATMAVSAAAPCVTVTASATEDTSAAVKTVQAADEEDSEEVVNGPEISQVTNGTDWSGTEYVYLPQLDKYSDDAITEKYCSALIDSSAVSAGTAKVIVNDTEMIASWSDDHPELVYDFSYSEVFPSK